MEQSQWLITAQLVYSVKQEIKNLEQRELELIEQLKALSNYESRIEAPYVFQKEIRKGSIEYAKIEVLKNINLDLYRKPEVVSWKLTKI